MRSERASRPSLKGENVTSPEGACGKSTLAWGPRRPPDGKKIPQSLPELLRQVVLQADLVDNPELLLKIIDVAFFVRQNTLKEIG